MRVVIHVGEIAPLQSEMHETAQFDGGSDSTKVLERKKVLSLTQNLGLLSALDRAGLNLAKVPFPCVRSVKGLGS